MNRTGTLHAILKNVVLVLLSCALIFGDASLAAKDQERKKSTASRQHFRFEEIGNKSVKLWEGERPVLVYNHGVMTSRSAPNAKGRSSYFHPVYGLDGEILTDDFPKDHENHRGLHWAWPHVKIDSEEVDLWSLRDIRQEFQRWLARETSSKGAVLGVENGWFVGDRRVLLERVFARIHPTSSQGRYIDLDLTLTPEGRPVTLWGAEGKSYGGLTLRFGPRSKTTITVPSGRSAEDLLITRLPWADLSGDLKGGDALSGATVFVNPKHPSYPPTWMTRHYGLLAVGWPGVTPQSLPAGKAVSLRYRIWIHRGVPETAEIQRTYDAYRKQNED
jgi:Methane oxygenase PmoA